MWKFLHITAPVLLCCGIAWSQQKPPTTRPATTPASASGDLLMTIYATAAVGPAVPDAFATTRPIKPASAPGFAIIQQRRTLDLQEGQTHIHLPDVPATVDFPTLSLRPIIPDAFSVLSQTLEERVTDPDALLRRAVGHEVIINRKQPGPADKRPPETINAKLLGFDEHHLVVETPNRQLPIQIIPRGAEISEIKLMADSAAPAIRSALSCRINARQSGPQEALLTYHAAGISWQADYDILLRDEKPTAQFTGAISILNRTGVAFEDARVNLVTRRLTEEARRVGTAHHEHEWAAKVVYPLPRATSLPKDAAHRVELVDAPQAQYEIVLACGPAEYERTPAFASTYLAIENTSKNALGIALPPGRVRVSRPGAANSAPILLADQPMPPIEPNGLILLRLGPPSQVAVKREIDRRPDTDRTAIIDSIRITLRNRGDQPQRVLLIEPMNDPLAQIIDKSDAFEKRSQGAIFTVNIPASGEKIVTLSVRHPAQ